MAYRGQPKSHRHAERGPDFYATPPEAVRALLSVYEPPPLIWEPACGSGSVVNTLRDRGFWVVASDLNDWQCPDSEAGIDFLLATEAPVGCDCIISNFPYRRIEAFAEHALELVSHVALLCRLAFLESTRRTKLLEESGLKRVIVFRDRLPMMHRHNWNGKKNSSSTAFAWFIWERGYVGSPQFQRVSWRAPAPRKLECARKKQDGLPSLYRRLCEAKRQEIAAANGEVC